MIKYFIYILSFITLISCCNDDLDCSGIACTEVFITISINIVDSDNNPVILDNFIVIEIDSKTDITLVQNEWMKEHGDYPIIDDSSLPNYNNNNTIDDKSFQLYHNTDTWVNFKGYINNEEVVNEDYKVSADCCHVELISGNTNLVVN